MAILNNQIKLFVSDELLYNQGIPLLLQIATNKIDVARRFYPLFIKRIKEL
ncbi:putative cytoplasmic protein [Salmonella enterica subsp. enterica]|uniref:Putative cytoplasmic protein n=1 Tax=Salmonella enterica I TaxID=59201 RepID=A0A3S5DMQ7_SALET|nr:putative cytoplasmic protein [Salmonella enterica subsp. enterica]